MIYGSPLQHLQIAHWVTHECSSIHLYIGSVDQVLAVFDIDITML